MRAIPVRRERPDAFLPGAVAPEHFPARVWSRLSARMWRFWTAEMVPYGYARGYGPPREAIADHLRRHRAVRCTPEQVLVTSGSQQALDLIARMLVNTGDQVALEEPGYRGAQVAFAASGARLVPIPVDRDGIDMSAVKESLADVRLLYTTPSHQYPLGVTLTLSRRLQLLEWAREAEAWIVEDDYDSEFRTSPAPFLRSRGSTPKDG